jgi:hypothetical protein
VPVHHVGELVVAVHQARDEVERPVRAQPVGGFAQTVEFTILDPLEEGGPAIDLTLVEAVGPPEVGQPLGFPVHLRQQCNALGQLVTQIRTGVQLTVERLGPHPVLIHRGPSVDEAHQIERATEHRRVVAYTDGGRVRNLGAVERLDDAHSRRISLSRSGGAPGGGMRMTQRSSPRVSS